MSYSYLFHPKAQEEYEAAIRWYLERSLKVAEDFMAAVDSTILLICNHPKRWRNQYKNFYELHVKRFPFVITYTIEPGQQQIIIMAVYHHKRSPERKYRQ